MRDAAPVSRRSDTADDSLLAAAVEVNRAFHAADRDRKALMLALSDRGLSARVIAVALSESPNSVSYWVRTARRERERGERGPSDGQQNSGS